MEENIVFALRRLKMAETEIQRRLQQVVKILKLEAYLTRKPADLSGGQRQRVAMGRAIIRNADCFLFDEPLSNLDAKLRSHMRTEIAQIHHEYGLTSVYVTHDQIEAMTLADKVVVLRDGMIEQVGSPMDIYLNPNNIFVATFIGSPSMNILDGTLTADYLQIGSHQLPTKHLSLLNTALNVPAEGIAVKVGIRPDFFNDKRYFSGNSNRYDFNNIDVELVEPMGFDKEILFSLAEMNIKARLDLRSVIERGNKMDLTVELSRILLFDTVTEQRL